MLIAGIASTALLLAASFRGERMIPIHVSANKLPQSLPNIYSAWNAMSLVQVMDYPESAKMSAMRKIVIDAGTAATGIPDLRPDVRTVIAQHPGWMGESTMAYAGKSHPDVLIIGSGAGAEVLAALEAHAASITAVEINPAIDGIVANRMNDYWGNLFHQPEVRLVTDEGRSFVRRSKERYDAIISVHTITNAAVSSGALSLAENYVLTREAFEDYLDHLKPDGVICFTRPEFQIARLFATAREVFTGRGMGSIANHVMAYTESGRRPAPGDLSFVAGFILQKSAIGPQEMQRIRAILGRTNGASSKILYAPDEPHPGSIYERLVDTADLEQVYGSASIELAPATDDKPFFNQHTRWSSIRWRTIENLFSLKQPLLARMALEDRPIAEVTLLILLVESTAIAGLCILAPLALSQRHGLAGAGRWRWLAYFAALGLGFMMVEIALLERFLLFLGEPMYTFAVVLPALLIFSGLGSYAIGRCGEPGWALRRVLPVLVIVAVVTAVIIPTVFHLFLGSGLPVRMAIAVLLIAPLGFVLGMPFPLGLRLVMQQSSALGSWAWGVNGFFTVIGTVLAQMFGMMVGFRMVLLLACACYVSAMATVSPPLPAPNTQRAVQVPESATSP